MPKNNVLRVTIFLISGFIYITSEVVLVKVYVRRQGNMTILETGEYIKQSASDEFRRQPCSCNGQGGFDHARGADHHYYYCFYNEGNYNHNVRYEGNYNIRDEGDYYNVRDNRNNHGIHNDHHNNIGNRDKCIGNADKRNNTQ